MEKKALPITCVTLALENLKQIESEFDWSVLFTGQQCAGWSNSQFLSDWPRRQG